MMIYWYVVLVERVVKEGLVMFFLSVLNGDFVLCGVL